MCNSGTKRHTANDLPGIHDYSTCPAFQHESNTRALFVIRPPPAGSGPWLAAQRAGHSFASFAGGTCEFSVCR